MIPKWNIKSFPVYFESLLSLELPRELFMTYFLPSASGAQFPIQIGNWSNHPSQWNFPFICSNETNYVTNISEQGVHISEKELNAFFYE